MKKDYQRKTYKKYLERIYKSQNLYKKIAVSGTEMEGLFFYIHKFFEKLEKNYLVPETVKFIAIYFIFLFINSHSNHLPFNEPKTEKTISLIREFFSIFIHEFLHGEFIYKNKKTFFSRDYVIKYLTDSYAKIFSDVTSNYKNKETFYKEIKNYIRDNINNYPNLMKLKEKEFNYRINIENWNNEKVYNPNWRTLVPVLDFFEKDKITIVYRLIAIYLLKNTLIAIRNILNIPNTDQLMNELITMIKEEDTNVIKKEIDKKYDYFLEIVLLCLTYQNQDDYDLSKADGVLKTFEKELYYKEFFSHWLKARSMIFNKNEKFDLDNKRQIINGYKTAFNSIKYAGKFSEQFLREAIKISELLEPRNVKNANEYFGYGQMLGIFFSSNKKNQNSKQKKMI